jgi:hypothetical protein
MKETISFSYSQIAILTHMFIVNVKTAVLIKIAKIIFKNFIRSITILSMLLNSASKCFKKYSLIFLLHLLKNMQIPLLYKLQ